VPEFIIKIYSHQAPVAFEGLHDSRQVNKNSSSRKAAAEGVTCQDRGSTLPIRPLVPLRLSLSSISLLSRRTAFSLPSP
jgi:hypothetical protein